MSMMQIPARAKDVVRAVKEANDEELRFLSDALRDDPRATVSRALAAAERRIDANRKERERLDALYAFDVAFGCMVAGLDEVGRGPLAGPLTVCAVVFGDGPVIEELNDSKLLTPKQRERVAEKVRSSAIAFAIEHVPPETIDARGMSFCLRDAFSRALSSVEKQGVMPNVALLDGNSLNFDAREVNVVKGDRKSASIAAASVVAKVERDRIMEEVAFAYPGYGFERNKGYGTKEHRDALSRLGPSPVHRLSFCSGFFQESLF